jgi:prepilin peptidase CpaA
MRSFAWWPMLVVLAVATFTDLRSRRIPNWLALPFLAAGVVISPWRQELGGMSQGFSWHGLGPFRWQGLGQSLAGLGVGLLIFGVGFWMGGMGGGDVKLAAAIGAWVGPVQVFWAVFFASLAGGGMAFCWLAWSGCIQRLFLGAGALVFGSKGRGVQGTPEPQIVNPLKRKMPYAPAIAIGTVLSFFVR